MITNFNYRHNPGHMGGLNIETAWMAEYNYYCTVIENSDLSKCKGLHWFHIA